MTRNNSLDKVHVAATELPQLLSQNTNTFGRGNRTKSLSDLMQLLIAPSEKINLLEVEGGHVPQWSLAGDSNHHNYLEVRANST